MYVSGKTNWMTFDDAIAWMKQWQTLIIDHDSFIEKFYYYLSLFQIEIRNQYETDLIEIFNCHEFIYDAWSWLEEEFFPILLLHFVCNSGLDNIH